MFKRRERLLAILLCMLFMASILVGCIQSQNTANKTASVEKSDDKNNREEKKPEQKRLSIMTVPAGAQFPDGLSISKNDWFDYIQEKTGFKLEWTLFKSGTDVNEQLMLILASGNAPDLIQANPSPAVANLARAGALTQLDEAFEKVAKNLKATLPNEALELGKIDGKLYILVRYTGGATIGSIAVRKDWLEELGLDIPKTLEEYYNVLKKFKEAKPDCIPLVVDGSLYRFIHFMGAFGIYSSGGGNFYIENGKVEYFAAVFIFKNIYVGKEEVGLGEQYIKTHWKEPFDANKIAKAAHLSKSHFTKLFKLHTGVTPYEYYINYKISKLKEKLLDINLTISQAFAACNMNYNGYSAKLFREKVGLTPSEYRKRYQNTK